jgi:hypothetical protein
MTSIAQNTTPVWACRTTAGITAGIMAAAMLGACGGGGGGSVPEPQSEIPPDPVVVPVDGPAWFGFGRGAQHTALASEVASQALRYIFWSTPVDLAPPYSATYALLAHYGSPLITRQNTVIVPVKTTAAGDFRVEARIGANGQALWALPSDYRLPPHNWVPSFSPALTPDGRVVLPAAGGRVLVRGNANSASGATRSVAFYGDAAYAAASATFDATVFINTPLTTDRQGNVFFGFTVTGANPAGLAGGIARIGADGRGTWVAASAAAADATMVKTATNSAPALSADERTVYAVVNATLPSGTRATGRLLALDSSTLATRAAVSLTDPLSSSPAWVNDNATSSPTVAPDGQVFIGVLEANAPAHNFRGWLLQFSADLAQAGTPGSFGWDNTVSVVPAAMLPQYSGGSPYLLLSKSNSYGGVGSGDGRHRMAILDPQQSQPDAFSSAAVMREVITVLGPTPDGAYPGGVKEWCVNTAVVDPLTNSVLMNSEDGMLYRWHLPSNALAERISLNNGYAQSYTPTALGADGRVYAVNNARLFSIGLR